MLLRCSEILPAPARGEPDAVLGPTRRGDGLWPEGARDKLTRTNQIRPVHRRRSPRRHARRRRRRLGRARNPADGVGGESVRPVSAAPPPTPSPQRTIAGAGNTDTRESPVRASSSGERRSFEDGAGASSLDALVRCSPNKVSPRGSGSTASSALDAVRRVGRIPRPDFGAAGTRRRRERRVSGAAPRICTVMWEVGGHRRSWRPTCGQRRGGVHGNVVRRKRASRRRSTSALHQATCWLMPPSFVGLPASDWFPAVELVRRAPYRPLAGGGYALLEDACLARQASAEVSAHGADDGAGRHHHEVNLPRLGVKHIVVGSSPHLEAVRVYTGAGTTRRPTPTSGSPNHGQEDNWCDYPVAAARGDTRRGASTSCSSRAISIVHHLLVAHVEIDHQLPLRLQVGAPRMIW